MSYSIAATKGFPFGEFHDYQPVSDGSEVVNRKWAAERNYLRGSASDWTPIVETAFHAIQTLCRKKNWAGEGARAITDQVIWIAKAVAETLFSLLPVGTPAPDIIPEADGEICISWSVDAARMFSLSIGEHGKINFAGQFGREGGIHGWQPLDTSRADVFERSLRDVVGYVAKLYAPTGGRRSA